MSPSTLVPRETRGPGAKRSRRTSSPESALRTLGRLSVDSVAAIAGIGARVGKSVASRLEGAERAKSGRAQIAKAETLGEHAADLAIAPVREAANLLVSIGSRVATTVIETPPGRFALSATVQGVKAVAATLPVSRPSAADARELRHSAKTVATSVGSEAALEAVAVTETMARLSLGDTRTLRHTIEERIERLRTLDVVPGSKLSETLRRRARRVADRSPKRLLIALNGGAPEGSSRRVAILEAALADRRDIAAFLLGYPLVLAKAGTKVVELLATDSLTLSELASFLEGRSFRVLEAPEGPPVYPGPSA